MQETNNPKCGGTHGQHDEEPQPAQAWWLSMQGHIQDLPDDVRKEGGTNAQRIIGCLETLAQIGLLVARHRTQGLKGRYVKLEQGSDSATAEGAINKLFSTKEPLSRYMWLFSEWCVATQISIKVHHIPGKANTWADVLSRSKSAQQDLGLSSDKHVQSTLEDLLQPHTTVALHPAKAQWPQALAIL